MSKSRISKIFKIFNTVEIIGIVVIVLIVIVTACSSLVAAIGANIVSETTITVEERIGAHGEYGRYLIISEEGEMFTVEDNIFRLQFDASDRYIQLKENQRYVITCTGWRIQLFSWYRNIVDIIPL
jgi:hypothetical protein